MTLRMTGYSLWGCSLWRMSNSRLLRITPTKQSRPDGGRLSLLRLYRLQFALSLTELMLHLFDAVLQCFGLLCSLSLAPLGILGFFALNP